MAFTRILPGTGRGNPIVDSEMVRISYFGGTKTTEIRLTPTVAKRLGAKPGERIAVAIDVGSGEHQGLIQIAKCPPQQDASKWIKTDDKGRLIIRVTTEIQPKNVGVSVGAQNVSFGIEDKVLTVLLPSEFNRSPEAAAYIREHFKKPEAQVATHNGPSTFAAPRDL